MAGGSQTCAPSGAGLVAFLGFMEVPTQALAVTTLGELHLAGF